MRLIRLAIPVLIIAAVTLSLAALYIYYNTTVKIIADGKEIVCRSAPVTVAELLKDHSITPGASDIVIPSADKPAPRRGEIRVIRVAEKIENLTETLPFIIRWSRKDTRNLRPVELQKGTQKIKTSLVKTVYHDGKPINREVLKQRVTSKTSFRLALLNKDGSWQCLYDLSQAKKIKMIATAYYPGDPLAWRDGTITFLGEKMQRGIVAVDPDVIPLKTRVYVSGYGYGWAGDTGSAIKKMRIDLGVNNREEEKDYMHVPVSVYILEKTDTW